MKQTEAPWFPSLANLHGTFHRLRQSGIDEELVSGFEALTGPDRHAEG